MGQCPNAFKERTVQQYYQLPTQTINTFGQRWSVQCRPDGLLSDLDVYIVGTITPGGSPSGSWGANYFPWNILSELRLDTTQSVPLFQTSGYGAFVIDSLYHRSYQQSPTPPASGGWNNTSNKGPRTGVEIAPSGSITASTAVPFGIHFRIPVAIDDGLAAGLVLLQNQATTVNVSGTIGAQSDFGTLGTGAAISASIIVLQHTFSMPEFGALGSDGLPANPLEMPGNPMLKFFHQWYEQDLDFLTVGDQIFQPQLGGIITRVVIDIQNNTVPLDFFSTASDPTTPNLGNVGFRYGGNQTPILMDARFMMRLQREIYGADLPAGILVHTFGNGGGSIELGVDFRDTLDTDLLSALQFITNVTASPTSGKIRYYVERLLRQ